MKTENSTTRVLSDGDKNQQSRPLAVTGSDEKGIVIVGRGRLHGLADEIARKLAAKETVLLETKSADIVVNGVSYRKIVREKQASSGRIASLVSMVAGFALSDPIYGGPHPPRSLNEKINIIEEYGRIQMKQSRLSRWERDRVVTIFESNYQRIE